MSSEQTKKAVEYALAFATAGAGASFSIKTFVPIPVIDAIPQTLIVKGMADQLASIYEFSSFKDLTIFTGKVVGAAGALKLASEVATFLPVAGPGTSAITSFALHMTTGLVLIIVFELLHKGVIPEDYIRNVTISDVRELLGLAAQAMFEIVRDNAGADAVDMAVDKFSMQTVQPVV
jgi:hypothetical protein